MHCVVAAFALVVIAGIVGVVVDLAKFAFRLSPLLLQLPDFCLFVV